MIVLVVLFLPKDYNIPCADCFVQALDELCFILLLILLLHSHLVFLLGLFLYVVLQVFDLGILVLQFGLVQMFFYIQINRNGLTLLLIVAYSLGTWQ